MPEESVCFHTSDVSPVTREAASGGTLLATEHTKVCAHWQVNRTGSRKLPKHTGRALYHSSANDSGRQQRNLTAFRCDSCQRRASCLAVRNASGGPEGSSTPAAVDSNPARRASRSLGVGAKSGPLASLTSIPADRAAIAAALDCSRIRKNPLWRNVKPEGIRPAGAVARRSGRVADPSGPVAVPADPPLGVADPGGPGERTPVRDGSLKPFLPGPLGVRKIFWVGLGPMFCRKPLI